MRAPLRPRFAFIAPGIARGIALGLALALPGAARAGDLRDFCPDRPGLNTPPCTIDAGHVSAEVSLLDWTRSDDADTRADTLLAGDLALRWGIDSRTELRFAWTPWGRVRSRDKATGSVAATAGSGDITLGMKRNLIGPDMSGFALAVLPSASVPTGGRAISAGDWRAGVQVPMSVPLGGPIALAVTPEIDAAVNGSGHGRHLAWGGAAGVSLAAGALDLALEGAVMHDGDPAGASTSATAGIAAGLMLGRNLQLDLAGAFGLNHATPGLRISGGFARRF